MSDFSFSSFGESVTLFANTPRARARLAAVPTLLQHSWSHDNLALSREQASEIRAQLAAEQFSFDGEEV
jgi:hypothetical protein